MNALILENLYVDPCDPEELNVKIIENINNIITNFDIVIFTKDLSNHEITFLDERINLKDLKRFYFFKKGDNYETFSAFYDITNDNNYITTSLTEFLVKNEVEDVYIGGINNNYDIENTVNHSLIEGFNTTLILDITDSYQPTNPGEIIYNLIHKNLKFL